MIFKVSSACAFRFFFLAVAFLALGACSPREQTRGTRWKIQVDSYLERKAAPVESNWKIKESEDDEVEMVERLPVTFPDVVAALPTPQSWPRLQSGMVLRFLADQGKGDWQGEIQNRLLHLFFLYVNDSKRYSTKRWSKAVERLRARLDAIEAKLPEDSRDRSMIEQVRERLKQADVEVKKRFGISDGLGEVKAFEEELDSMEPTDRKKIAALVGGEANLAAMEKTLADFNDAMQKLVNKYGSMEDEAKERAFGKEVEVLSARFESRMKGWQQALENPEVQNYLMEERASGAFDYVRSVEVPDVVTIVGAEKAEVLLKRALLLPVELQIETGDETRNLARKLALQYVEQLKAPQWDLVQSLQGVELFEALQKRFPEKEDDQNRYERTSAQIYYLFGLIARDRSDDALTWMGKIYPAQSKDPDNEYSWSIPSELLEQMKAAGYEGQVWNFLAKLLDKNPEVPFWDDFIALSTRLEKNPEMLVLVERTAKRPGLSEKMRWKMRENLAKAYLASDRVDEGVAMLRQGLSAPGTDPELQQDRYDAALQLAELGQILQRADWIAEGLAAAEAYTLQLPAKDMDYYDVSGLVTMYEKLGRASDAERVLKAGLVKLGEARQAEKAANAANGDMRNRRRSHSYSSAEEARFMEALVALYVSENRDREAIALLTQSPDWGKADLADFLKDSAGYPSYPLGYWSSWALGRLGQAEESLAIAKGQIRVRPESDGAYAILTQLQGRNSLSYLDSIYQMDQFEERPLIWKAKVLCDAGELEAAERTALAAIAVDPSDGEQGKGDRMRVYAVMAEIQAKKGNVEKADFFKDVMRAIRLAEEADDYEKAGLNTRAIAMYKEALGFFSEAYCIQSRLALQLMQEQREEEALVHYQKAYELMPDSFGRVESHCFGCEGAFEGKKAQGIAERVFTEMLKKQPGKPQIHYLLGYLREEQGNYAEALKYFRQAVELDPLYLNAWKHIAGLKDHIRIDPRILDEVQLKLLALDPSGKHSYPRLDSVNDLPKLWGHMAMADRVLNTVPVPEAVFELTASAEALRDEKLEEERLKNPRRDEKTFASILLQHPAVRLLGDALEVTRRAKVGAGMGTEEMLEY